MKEMKAIVKFFMTKSNMEYLLKVFLSLTLMMFEQTYSKIFQTNYYYISMSLEVMIRIIQIIR